MAVSNVPGESTPVNPTITTQPSYLESPAYKNLPPSEKDSLTKSLSTDELNARFPVSTGQIPELSTPQKKISLKEYLAIRSSTLLSASKALEESEQTDLQLRRAGNEAFALQAAALANLINGRDSALENLNQSVKEIEEQLRQILETMEEQTKNQKDLTDSVNAGNAEEQRRYEALTKAYDQYIADLKSIGAVDKGNGHYEIPEESMDQFNEITAKYQNEVASFNTYWAGREKQLLDYNAATATYNQNVDKNNQALDDLLESKGLTGFRESQGIPYQQKAGTRDLSNYAKQLDGPKVSDYTPARVDTAPPPNYAKSIGQSGPPTLASPGTYPSQKNKNFAKAMKDQLYQREIGDYDQKIAAQTHLINLLKIKSVFVEDDKSRAPSLNYKPLMARLLPETSLDLREPASSKNSGLLHSIDPTLEVGDPDLEKILGGENLRQLLAQFFPDLTEAGIKELSDKLLIFSVSQLSNDSLQALFPGLSLVFSSLLTLPKDSPALALLFAVSFVNRVQEMSQLGLTNESLETFISKIPALTKLNAKQKNQLASTLNVGALLVAGKLLEANLGLSGLMGQILPQLITDKPEALLLEAAAENQQNRAALGKQVEQTFVDQGYAQETAQFLAKVSTQLVDAGLSAPTVPSVPSADSINAALLTDSIQASLLLAKGPTYSLAEAREIASESVSRALGDAPYYTTNQFREALESNLKDFGLRDNTEAIVRDAVIILPQETALAKPMAEAPVTQAAMIEMIQARVNQLIAPQLGIKLAKQVTEEVVKSLFGTTATEAAPFSLVGVLRNELYHRTAKQDVEFAVASHEDFKKTIEEFSTNLNAFLLKLQDPLAVYTHIGLMYERNDGKQKNVFV